MKAIVSTAELCRGMFVADLDRPWLETPFLLQGFLIEEDGEIAQLQQLCRTVTVDYARSAEHVRHRGPVKRAEPPKPEAIGRAMRFTTVEDAGPDDFLAICRLLREKPSRERYAKPPSINAVDGQSRLESEMLYTAPIVEDIKLTLQSIRTTLDLNNEEKLQQIGALVGELAESVQRNPDAVLWLTRLKSTDQYTYDHAVDVSVHLMIFGRFLNFTSYVVENLGLAGILQDIGKIDIPKEILNKTDPLTDEEYALIQSHVASSLDMLAGRKGFGPDVLNIIASHHERHDGSGYPRRLQGEKIALNAEIAGMIDAYCAMTRNRVYNIAISHQRALEDLIHTRGSKFRAPLVDQFIQCMGLYPVGTLVELNSGEVAAVIQQNRVRRLQPRVLIVLAKDKSIERYPRTLDLMMHPEAPTGEPYRILRSLPPDAYGIDPRELYLA